MQPQQFSNAVIDWYDRHGRKDLPWQQPITPYRVWISEVMLQQTQVATVIPYFQRFMHSFPNVRALAAADIDQVLHHWTGLGYYARARNLHRAAIEIVSDWDGELPDCLEALQALPGIGRSTAGAILAIAFAKRAPILDGNVKRVLARYHAVPGWPGQSAVLKQLWSYAEAYTPEARLPAYTQAMMDLGATLCTRSQPDCERCPLASHCQAYGQGNPQDYPGRKPRKELPKRQRWWLVLRDREGRVLLEKRPPAGLWGGLWCLPEFACEAELESWLRARSQSDTTPLQALPALQHTFTHFQLQAHPLAARLKENGAAIMEAERFVWYNLAQPLELGLATPVKKLLGQLQQTPVAT